jgi:hopanoid biosynthesis associated radical SAM protein HpnJ
MKRILFLNPPSYEGFDGGAGSRYQARREVRSFWYPTWLAQAAALCPGSRVIDAPAEDLNVEETVRAADGYDVLVIYTSTPGFQNDAGLAERMAQEYPEMLIGMVGPHCTALPEDTLNSCKSLGFVARREFDYTVLDVAKDRPLRDIQGISYRKGQEIIHNGDRDPIQDMDTLPSVLDVYRRDLNIQKYFIGYLLHPYLSVYTGRGCPGRCTFCLWPQTLGGHRYRTHSVDFVVDEMARAKDLFPEVKEFFFDDDTFTADFQRAEAIARGLRSLEITWSCSSRANISERTLKILKENGLRLVMVGIESGSDRILRNIRKGITTSQALAFMKTCRKLKIATHATFAVGLPGETRDTIRQTIEFAKEIDPDTIQVSIATPYPGTRFYQEAIENGWFTGFDLVSNSGVQQVSIEYEDFSKEEIFKAVEELYHHFYFRYKPIVRILRTMISDKDTCMRRLREAKEFFQFLRSRKRA